MLLGTHLGIHVGNHFIGYFVDLCLDLLARHPFGSSSNATGYCVMYILLWCI